MPAAVVSAIPMVISGISAIGGLVQGAKGAEQNQALINSQNQQILGQQQLANRLANSVSKADYQEMASRDSRSALRDVFSAMANRGVGNSTAAITASSNATAQIQSAYGKQYLTDRLSAISGAAGILGQAAGTQRLGYDSDPYAGYKSGLAGLANGLAYQQGKAGTTTPAATATVPQAMGAADPAFGYHYKYQY